MQSTGQTSTQDLSLTSMHGSTITYAIPILLLLPFALRWVPAFGWSKGDAKARPGRQGCVVTLVQRIDRSRTPDSGRACEIRRRTGEACASYPPTRRFVPGSISGGWG